MEKEIKKSARPLILIVDDVPKNLQVLGGLLNKLAYKIAAATSGIQALSMLDQIKPDLILLDVMMPEMNGFEVCEHIKARPDTKHIPIIFLTAKTDTESTIKGFEKGAMDYVTKPFNPSELLSRIKTHLDLKLARDALESSETKLRKANVTKDKFFSILAHDLKDPFQAMLGITQLLSDQYDTIDDQRRKLYIEQILKGNKHLYRLVENLLQWARIQKKSIQHHPNLIDIAIIVADCIKVLKPKATQKSIDILSSIAPKTLVYADPNAILMVIRNLVNNAIKFSRSETTITIGSHSKGDMENIWVQDQGVGMTDAEIQKLFKLSTHFSLPGTLNEKGTGLGLIICQEFIRLNNGELMVSSEKNHGSTFSFSVPKSSKKDFKSEG